MSEDNEEGGVSMGPITAKSIRDGYTFLNIGQLYQTAFEINTEACRRFGAEKAGSVMATAIYDADKSAEYILSEIKAETGLIVTPDDLEFLGKVTHARQLISEVLKLLQAA